MKIAILLLSERHHDRALEFAVAAIASGHEIYRVFLYADAVAIAARQSTHWPTVTRDLVVCISAAERRGLSLALNVDVLPSGFAVSGLGQLVDAAICADRLVTFP